MISTKFNMVTDTHSFNIPLSCGKKYSPDP